VGIRLEMFFIVREGEYFGAPALTDRQFRYGFIGESEVDELMEFRGSPKREEVRLWLDQGKRCFAAWEGPRLAATMWCDFQEFNYPPNYRRLNDDEVYMFAAFAHADYRGQNLAPNMRLQCYQALEKMGRHSCLSYTDYFNVAARRFKEKLGARNKMLRLHICLFGRWSRTLTLRTY